MEAEITFTVETCPKTAGFIARWNDPRSGGITTQGDTLGELQEMITDAVSGYFDPTEVRGDRQQGERGQEKRRFRFHGSILPGPQCRRQ